MFSDLGGFVQLRGEMLQAHGNAYYGAVGGGSGNCSEFETGHACNDFFGVPPFEEGTDTQSMNYKGGYDAGFQAGLTWGKVMLEKSSS
mmetsp:Transcript_17232/g.26660  ORF Transcript_17232/g.26660 Transcript_17232/m.26660 type:complete len:88 (-) Transcript_17232:162-425(-)|eukprot:CAMPEP_0184304772 /NCGR_PEP_ID=MMETSP1049-20130417/14207_1 /TAXON_ID=77928 /ORGANISM="Proteomonas sulcata, Strain CCMP704" /LENGTH=87 /DNA_ID=CAMNT_0026616661 /DNA_START=809 /DNA_END=1072 /DNA_ORIENTATION=+